MATTKGKRKGNSVGGFFRKIYKAQPHFLDLKSNKDVFALWLKAHPNEKVVPKNIQQNLANVKSNMRRQRDEAQGGGTNARGLEANSSAAPPAGRSKLEMLEMAIDDCMTKAWILDPQGLQEAIKYLRRARNLIILIQGA